MNKIIDYRGQKVEVTIDLDQKPKKGETGLQHCVTIKGTGDLSNYQKNMNIGSAKNLTLAIKAMEQQIKMRIDLFCDNNQDKATKTLSALGYK